MSQNKNSQSTEKLLGLIRNGGGATNQSLLRIVRHPAPDPAAEEAGRRNPRFCEVSAYEQPLARLKFQFDAIWSNLLLSQGKPPRNLLLTSASKGEGVSYVSERFCLYLTQTYGHKVLYVNIADPMSAPDAPAGPDPEQVVSALGSSEGIESLTLDASVPGLRVLSLNLAGGRHAQPWLLPQQNVMETLLAHGRERYDMTLIDAQPVLSAPWTATMAKPADATLVVCRFAVTRREVLNAMLEALKNAGVVPRGVILNDRRYCVPPALYKLMK